MSLADDLAALSRVVVPCGVPGLPGVHLRMLTLGDAIAEAPEGRSVWVHWILRGACDAEGNRIYGDDDDAKVLALPVGPAKRLALAISEHNRMRDAGEEDPGGKAGGTP